MDFMDSMDMMDMDEAMAGVSAVVRGISVVMLIIGLLGSMLGFKLTKIVMGICAFFVGLGIGIGLNIKFDEPIYAIAGLILGIVLAVFSYKFFKVGVFLKTFFDALPFGAILMALAKMRNLIPKNLESLDSFDTEAFLNALVTVVIGAAIFSVFIAVLAVIFTKPVIILTTSISFGPVAGIALGLIISMENRSLGYILSVVFIAAGIAVQTITNGGFLEKKKAPVPVAAGAAGAVAAEVPVSNAAAETVTAKAAAEVSAAETQAEDVKETAAEDSEANSPEIK